jgi:cyclohexadieny/prephenate dehydrogenase
MAEPLFGRLTLIGIGLIGSSIALAAKRAGLVSDISIQTRSKKTLERAIALGLGDSYSLDPAEAVRGADLVIVCVPVGASEEIAQQIAPSLKPGAIISDVGSVKSSVVAQMRPHLPGNVHFVPAHPIAGTEHSGPDAGFAELFENRWCILTPVEGTDTAAVDKLVTFWRGIGANVEVMSPEHHDLVLAITSHIPHLIAYNIVGTAADMEENVRQEVIKFSASGFRDFTRIAASDPTMWRDIFLHNKDAVLEMLGRFTEDLTSLQRAIRRGDGDTLFELFTRTRAIRRGILDAGQDTAVPDFGRTPAAKGHGTTDKNGA